MVGALVAAVIALVASAAVALGLVGTPTFGPTSGTVVKVSLTDSGGPMGEGTGMMHPGAMGLSADQTTVPHGPVSFVVTNAGSVNH